MDKIFGSIKNIFSKIGSMNTTRKVALGIISSGIIIAIILFANYNTTNKYGALFSNLSSQDAKTVTDALKSQKVDSQIKGNTIYVPKEQVDSLRLTLASSLTSGSKGYELLLQANQFGMSDDQYQTNKVIATQGELEKTIKSVPEIENVRVLLTVPKSTAFVQDTVPAKASVYLQLKVGNTLKKEQVSAIIALVAGAVQGLDKQNVEVIDDKLNLLSKGLVNGTADLTSAESVGTRQEMQTSFETKLANNITTLLEPAFGTDKINVKVSADLDFNSNEKTVIAYDPTRIIVSSHITSNDSGNSSIVSQSPVTNNIATGATGTNGTTPVAGTNSTTTTTPVTNVGGVSSTSTTTTTTKTTPTSPAAAGGTTGATGTTGAAGTTAPTTTTVTSGNVTKVNGNVDETLNYQVGQTQTKTVSAPGEVKRITAAVMLDGVLTDTDKAQIQKVVASAIGYKAERGDDISILAMNFDPLKKAQVTNEMNTLKEQSKQSKNMQLYKTIAIAVGALAAFIILFILIIKIFNPRDEDTREGLNAIIGDQIQPRTEIETEPAINLNLDASNNKNSIEKEIRKYATEKPDQVADIVKAWLSGDEG